MDEAGRILEWPGTLEPGQLKPSAVAASHGLADAAKSGDWPTVLRLLDEDEYLNVNQIRPRSRSWFTVLHQAAWHGAPTAVVEQLLQRGALRTLRDAHGRTACDVATERVQRKPMLQELLNPPVSPLTPEREHALDEQLGRLIDSRLEADGIARGYGRLTPREVLRYPPVGILHEVPAQQLWFPVPGMYGGFNVLLRRGYLEVSSWIRVVGGSGQTHVVTHRGATLVDEGFV